MPRAGADVLQVLEGLEGAGVDEPGADQDVLVREGQHGPAELGGDDGLQHLLPLGVALHRGQAPQQARGAADPLQGAERKSDQLSGVTNLGDQNPLLGLLRYQADVEAGRTVGDDVGHVGQLGIRQSGAVFRFDSERHTA